MKGDNSVHLELFSPAPIGSVPFHYAAIVPVNLLNRFHSRITASWRAIPVPAMMHKIDTLPSEVKKYSLPILPNTDFVIARQGEGPPCHCYNRAFTELRFVATLCCGTWGVTTYDPEIKTPEQLIGRKIGVEPEGGAPRVLMDAVLRDAWGIYNKVVIVECGPLQVKQGLLSRDLDATFWVRTWEVVDGFACGDLGVLDARETHWVSLSREDVERINNRNPWKTHRVLMPRGSIRARGPKVDPQEDVGLPGFTSALCAWENTEGEVVYELLRFLDEKSQLWPDYTDGCPLSLARMSRFPGITEDTVHAGALRYYNEKGIRVGDPVQLRRLN